MKLVGHFEITKGYDQWKSVFLSNEDARKEWGISTIFAGMQTDNPKIVHVCVETESLERLQEFVTWEKNTNIQEEAGINLETLVMVSIIE